MSTSMVNPHDSMVSFQSALLRGELKLDMVSNYQALFSYFDIPEPEIRRLTYVRLSKDHKTVKAFLSCVMNGRISGFPCIAVGYAVPENARNNGNAKQILRDVVNDQIFQAGRNGIKTIYIEAVVDVTNLPSQRVAESVLNVERESITDSVSERPAYRYTARFDTGC